jgi:hypothetical protein
MKQKLHKMDTIGFQYGLHLIKKLTSYLNSPDSMGIKSLEEEKIAIRKSFQMGFNYTTGILTIKVIIDFLCRTENPEPLKLFGTTVQCDFKLLEFEEILKKNEKDQVDIPDDLMITLLSVGYSTTRGILVTQTAGTEYSNYFLPLVNISEFKTMLKRIGESTSEKLG